MKLINIETPATRNFIRQILFNVQDFYFHKVGYTSYDEGVFGTYTEFSNIRVKVQMVDIVVARDVSSIVKTVVVRESRDHRFEPVEHCTVAGGTVVYFEMHTRNTCCLVRDTRMISSLLHLQETGRRRH
jgi:hypothetical protein